MATVWGWLDAATALPRCTTRCTLARLTAPPEPSQSRTIELRLFGPSHRPCSGDPAVPAAMADACTRASATSGSWPALVEAHVIDGFGARERYWYALGSGWIGYRRTDDHGVEDHTGSAEQHPDWHMPDFDCRGAEARTPEFALTLGIAATVGTVGVRGHRHCTSAWSRRRLRTRCTRTSRS
jgi:hypothetical protein